MLINPTQKVRPISGFDKYLSKVSCANFGAFLQKWTFRPFLRLRQRTSGRFEEKRLVTDACPRSSSVNASGTGKKKPPWFNSYCHPFRIY